jgi:serine/threonine protein kinase
MTPERWQEVKRIFDAAAELEPEKQEAYLASTCEGDLDLRREVSALLASLQDAGTRYDGPVVGVDPRALGVDPMVGRQFGPYKVLRRLGMGGMGAVYLAARADEQFRRLAAVKAIRAELVDDHTRRRFENERHTLAALDHPNIVKLLDGGTTPDGIPYLVMDYVEGQPIDRFTRERSLSITEILELFRTLCAAVQYAHQNLVVHRDLKPTNVLVTPQGVPKLLDFGIAKLLRPEYALGQVGFTRTAAQPMTPEYASPEQVLGQPITTATDIYSLGVVLFTLLTGKHPFEHQTNSSYELERAICERPAGPPSAAAPPDLARRLRGDLDTIVLCALRKEPQKRYASVERFSEDIGRYLEGKPVAARGDSFVYRAQKFVGRHLPSVALSTVAVVLLAALGISDHIDRVRAEKRFADLRDFANFTINDLDPAMRTSLTAARESVATKAVAYLDGLAKESSGDRALELEVMNGYLKVADIQGNLFVDNVGKPNAAKETLGKARALAEDISKRDPKNPEARAALLKCHEKLGDVIGKGDEALAEFRKALELAPTEIPGDNVARLRILTKIAFLQADTDPGAALATYRECESAARSWVAREPGNAAAKRGLALAQEGVGWNGLLAGDPSGAEQSMRDAIAIYEETAGPKPSMRTRRNLAISYKRLAEIQKRTGKAKEALESCRRSLASSEALRAEDPKNNLYGIDVAQERVLLIDILLTDKNTREARKETATALAYLKPLALVDNPDRYYLIDYVTILATTPFPDLASSEETVRLAAKAAQDADPETLDLLAKAYARANRMSEAVATEGKAIALLPPAKQGPTPEIRRKLEASLEAFRAQPAQH